MYVKICCKPFEVAIKRKKITGEIDTMDMSIDLIMGDYFIEYCPFCGKKIEIIEKETE